MVEAKALARLHRCTDLFVSSLLTDVICAKILCADRNSQGHIAQLVAGLTEDQGVASFILARSLSFVEIDHEIISTAILLPTADSRRIVVSYK